MGNGEMSTDLALGILPSASPGRAAEEHAANPEGKAKVRRRRQPESEDKTPDDLARSSAAGDQPTHQLDRLA